MEDSCVFRHLALASLWKGETLAAACSGGRLDDVRIEAYKGVVIPPAIEDVYYHVAGIKLYGRVGNAVNILTYSAGWSGDYMIDGHLTISDARVIEDKFDNGDPDSGKVYVTAAPGGSECLTATLQAIPASADWRTNFNSTQKSCGVHFWID